MKYDKAKEGIGHSIFRRLYNYRLRDAFNQWRRKQNHQIEVDTTNSTNIEKENEQIQKDRIEKSRVRLDQIREKSKFDTENLLEE